jgi:hypothetical protein
MTLASESRLCGALTSSLLAGALLLCAPSARAEDAETRSAARDLATQGAQAFDAGQYAEASDFFRRAHELVQAPSIALLQARSLAKLGALLEAIDIYEQTARFKLTDDAPPAYAQAVQTAHTEVEEVRRRVPRLKLTLVGLEPGDSPQVTIDEKPMPPVLLGVARPINPGEHHIVVSVGSEIRATRDITLVEGESNQVQLSVQPIHAAAKPVAVAPPPAIDSAPAPSSQSSLHTLGYVALGVGVVGLGLGTYTGLTALHHKSDLDSVCHPECPASSAGDIDSFRTNRTVSWISYGVGIAAAATGIVLLTIGKPSGEHVAIRALPNGLQIGGQL